MFTLYQFEFSHFCEKVRWALDYKDIPYRSQNLLPGPHLKVAKQMAPKTCVPILANDEVIQESGAIITHLDQRYPDHPLTPENPMLAKEALDWEAYLDEEVGVTLRLWYFFHALPDGPATDDAFPDAGSAMVWLALVQRDVPQGPGGDDAGDADQPGIGAAG